MKLRILFTLSALIMLTSNSFAAFHRCEDAAGNVSYTDEPCKNAGGSKQIDTKQKLTQSSVRALLKNIERATARKDVSGLIASFSKDAKLIMKGANSGSYTVNQYKAMVKEAWALQAEFTHTSKNINISIDPSGMTATVSSETVDTIKLDGAVVTEIKASEKMHVIATSGQPLVKKVATTAL